MAAEESNNLGVVEIKNGPSAHRLIDAFKYVYDRQNCFMAEFTIMNDKIVKAKIISLEHEDSSGCSFNFKAYVTDTDNREIFVGGYYNARTRKGKFTN